MIDLSDYDKSFRPALRDRLIKHGIAPRGSSALCLAARLGTEVKAFRDAGCFAAGIDIDERQKNAWVLYGDFHKLEFPDQGVDIIYCNSIDRVFDIAQVMGEVRRVLKADGTLILEIVIGAKQGQSPGEYEAFWWDSIDDLAVLIGTFGFTAKVRDSCEIPWPAEMIAFAVNPSFKAENAQTR